MRRLDAAKYPEAELSWVEDKGMNAVLMFGEMEVGRYPMFKSESVDPVGVMLDTRRKWYPHISEIEARGLAFILEREVKGMTLVLAYRPNPVPLQPWLWVGQN